MLKQVQQAVGYSLANAQDGVTRIQEAGEAFETIHVAINEIADQVTDISAVTEEISAAAEEIAASVNQISSNSKHSATLTTDVSNAVQEQVSTIEEINSVSKDLGEKQWNYNKVSNISKFKSLTPLLVKKERFLIYPSLIKKRKISFIIFVFDMIVYGNYWNKQIGKYLKI